MQMSEIYFVVHQASDGGYTACALGQSIFTEAGALVELRTAVQDAVRCHFDDGRSPKIIRLLFERDELIAPHVLTVDYTLANIPNSSDSQV